MKELSIEEKAKAYDVAIERAKSFIENGDETEKTISESIFAGLMDVSEDENIKQFLISFIKMESGVNLSPDEAGNILSWVEKQGEQKPNPYSGTSFKYNGHIWGMCARDNGVDILLDSQFLKHFEKQGEQKSTDKVEPKFKKGDWIINSNGTLRHIVDVSKTGYQTDYGWLTHDDYEKTYHLWAIQDAKDGDVLVSSSGKPFIFKGFFDNDPMAYGGLVADDSFWPASNSNWTTVYCKPATKEQRDLLFQKMKEGGYEWDAEKKELKKVESKSAWSEDDERMFNIIVENLDNGEWFDIYQADWLKSLKERYTWKPSDEQIEALLKIEEMHVLEHEKNQENAHLYMVIKSLKEQLFKLKGK